MGDFNNYKLFKNVGIRSSDNKLIVMNVNKSNNVSFYSSDGGTNNIDVMSINSIINKSQNEDLNLSSLNGTTINPVITINNNHNDCRIMTNLNVAGNVNITKNLNVSNTVVNHNLIIPKYDNDNSLLSNVIGSIYYNTTENMYEGYSNDGWQPLGGFSKTKDAIIHKNVNVLQNINCTDKITSNVNIINHNLIIPKHNKDSILLSNTLGSIYYNTTENMYEGFSNEGWQPLGGFSKSKDATIYKNLNVLGNLNITGNMNQINSTQITVNDKNIVLASNNNADNHAEDGGIILQGATQKSLLWKSANGWKSSEKITAPHLDTVANQLLIGNTQVGLNLNFSGNNLHINGNIPKAGQVLIGTNSEVKWADTDYTLVNNQLIKVITETVSASGIFGSASVLDLSSSNSYNQTYTTHDGYTLNNDTKKIIIIFNFAVVDSNLVSKIKLEVLIDNVSKKTVIFKNMTGNQINDFVKYFTLTSTEYGSGSKTIKFKFTDMNNTGTIKIFTEDGTSVKQPTITLQEIGDQNIKTILDETRGSKSDQIAKILVNTNATATTQILNTSQTTNYVYPYELHSSYTPSVSDTGTIIIIVNFALYISFNNNLTSKLKLELLLNNGSDTTIPQERKIILQEMNSNRSYEYTKYFSISKTAFGTGNKIELRFTDMNNSGNIKLFTNDDTNVKQPTVTIQEIGSTTGWGSSIENIPIGQTTSADGSFNKVVVKNNLDVSGNLNINNNLNIINRVSIGTDKPSEASDTTDTYKLLVYDNTNTNGSFIRIESDTGINGIPSGIEFINSAYKSDNTYANETYSSGRIISKWPAGANGSYSESIVQIQNAKSAGPPSGWVDALTCRNGNVGIGTNNPQQLLDVYGNSEIKGGVKIKPGGASLHLYEANQTGATFLKLEAAGSNNDAKVAPCIIEFYTNCGGQSSGNRWDYATRTTFSSGRIISTWDEISSSWSDSMVKIQNATSNTTFTDTLTCRNGSIGIGTTYPDLDENSEADIKIGNNMLIKSKEVGTSLRPYVTGGIGNVNAPGIYYNGGSHYLVIDHCGDSQTHSAIWFRQYAPRMYFYCNEGRSGTHDAVFDFRTRASGDEGSWTLTIKGDDTAVSSNATNSLSDDRLKINEELITNATFTILKLRPQKYDFYTNKEKTKTTLQNGLIAQEIYYECPEIRHLVRVPDDFKEIDNPESLNFDDIKNDPNYSNWGTEYASVSYTGFIPLLIRGFQEQQNEINTLKTANAELTSIIDKLKTANSFEEFKQTF